MSLLSELDVSRLTGELLDHKENLEAFLNSLNKYDLNFVTPSVDDKLLKELLIEIILTLEIQGQIASALSSLIDHEHFLP